MSMNWKEIDLVLSEISLPGNFIQGIYQEDYRHLILELYAPGRKQRICIATENQSCRIARLNQKTRRMKKTPRFAEFLRARVKGGRIIEAGQLERERIIKLRIRRGEEDSLLWIRLWGGSSNLLLTDGRGRIIDVLFRRPARGEETGGIYTPESELERLKSRSSAPERTFELTRLPGKAPFCEEIEDFYRASEQARLLTERRKSAIHALDKQENTLRARIEGKKKQRGEYEDEERLRFYGDLIMSQLYRLKKGDRSLTAEDYTSPGTDITLPLDPRISPRENAEQFYQRARKARSGQKILEEDIHRFEKQLEDLLAERMLIDEIDDPVELEQLRKKHTPLRVRSAQETRDTPGLEFFSGGFRILAGRTAAENDALLRTSVRGNDLWLHTRDYPGGYIFIKTIRGKSVPLDVLLDAGQLALHFSKARRGGQAEVYYTEVKYLRRTKTGPKGLVIPTQDRNLSIVRDPGRLEKLLGEPETAP